MTSPTFGREKLCKNSILDDKFIAQIVISLTEFCLIPVLSIISQKFQILFSVFMNLSNGDI